MQKISIVIVCKNEEETIGNCLSSLQEISDDILVLDSGSEDATREIVRRSGARLVETSWEGYGRTKNKAIQLAKYDWIFSVDGDEVVDKELGNEILKVSLINEKEVYRVRFKNFFAGKYLRFGEWGNDWHIRIFNRKHVSWNDDSVHEGLQMNKEIKVSRLKGNILHYTMKDVVEYAAKMTNYALLNAHKYADLGKRSSWLKIYLSSSFTFLKYYFFKLGFLDGWVGFVCAGMTSYYTFIKYARLKELNKQGNKNKR